MSGRARLVDLAELKQHGYKVERFNDPDGGWCLLDSDGANLMIGDHGCVAPTQWEAVAEGLSRIAQDARCERAANASYFKVVLSESQHAALESAARTCIEQWDGTDELDLAEQDAIREALAALMNAEAVR